MSDNRTLATVLRLSAVALVVTLLACVPIRPASQAARTVALKIVVLPRLSWAPFYIAREEGFFAEQGLEVEFIQMERSADAVPLVAQGEVDVISGTINAGLINAIARDARIKFVADKGYYAEGGCAYSGLLARRNLVESDGLASLPQLRGRRIAMDRATFEGYYVGKLLGTSGMTLDEISLVEIPSTASALQGLQDGSLDLAALSEPWLTRGIQGGYAVMWMPVQDVIPDFQAGFVVYGPTLLEKNQDAGHRFMLAYRKAVRQYNLGKTPRNLDILAKAFELDRGLLEASCWQPFRADGHINAQSVVDFQAWALKEGYLDAPVGEERFWDSRFLDRANQTLAAAS